MSKKHLKTVLFLILISNYFTVNQPLVLVSVPLSSSIKNNATDAIGVNWIYSTSGSIRTCPAVADVNGDGYLEVLVSSRDRNLYCISHEGTVEWVYRTKNTISSSPTIADVDNDELSDYQEYHI